MITNKKVYVANFEFAISRRAGVMHIKAESSLRTEGQPVISAYCLVGDHGEVMIAPVDFWSEANNVPTTVATAWVRKNINKNSIVTYCYGERGDGDPDWRLRRQYTEITCLREAIKYSKKSDGFKRMFLPFLKDLKKALEDMDKGVEDDGITIVSAGALRTSYSLEYSGRKQKTCVVNETAKEAEKTVEEETPATIEDTMVVAEVQDVSPAEEIVTGPISASVSAPEVSVDMDALSIVMESIRNEESRNALVVKMANFIQLRREEMDPLEKTKKLASYYLELIEAAKKFIGKE